LYNFLHFVSRDEYQLCVQPFSALFVPGSVIVHMVSSLFFSRCALAHRPDPRLLRTMLCATHLHIPPSSQLHIVPIFYRTVLARSTGPARAAAFALLLHQCANEKKKKKKKKKVCDVRHRQRARPRHAHQTRTRTKSRTHNPDVFHDYLKYLMIYCCHTPLDRYILYGYAMHVNIAD
jgi:hypothetical protein